MKSKRYVSRNFLWACTALVTSVGCSSGKGVSASAPLSVSGVLNVTSSQNKPGFMHADSLAAESVDITALKVVCSTTSAPVVSGSASIAGDGSFKVNIEGAQNQPLSCYLADSGGVKKADFLISDSSKLDLRGNQTVAATTAYKKDASLGTINYDSTAGEVTVPAANVASVIAPVAATAAPLAFDPSGAWTISPVDFTLKPEVRGACEGGDCDGPPNGQALYLKIWEGLQTSDNSTIYGLQVWESPGAYAACGSKVGLSSADKTSLGISFPTAGAADAAFTYSTSVANFADPISGLTSTVTIAQDYKMSTAKTTYALQPGCQARDITIGGIIYSNAWVCGPDAGHSTYQVQLAGGCRTSAGTSVQVNDWNGLTCPSPVMDSDRVFTQTCSGTKTIDSVATAVTCTNTYAVLDSAFHPVVGIFDYSALPAQIASGSSCSGIADAALGKQCYANYYSQSRIGKSASACLPKVKYDWSTADIYVDKNHPSQLVFFEQFKPFPDGSGGSMLARQEHYEGVQVNGNFVNCHVLETGGLTIKKVNANRLLATYQSSKITTSVSKPACLAGFAGKRTTFMFYLNK